MSIYHFSISNVSRAKGSSSTATLSYITGEKVKDERTGETFYGFGRKERIQMTGVLLPETAPERFQNPKIMINEIEMYEKAENARPAKKIEMALPRELDPDQRKSVVENFIRNNLNSVGYGAVYAMHNDKDDKNPHCHILIPNRQITAEGWQSTKRKMEYALDENGERIPLIDKTTGQQKTDARNRKQWKRISVEQNPLDRKEMLKELRESWSIECNKYLKAEQKIDHRSNQERGLETEPTKHEGYAAREIVARGGVSDIVEENKRIKERNSVILQLKEIGKQIAVIMKEKGENLNERIGNLLRRRFGEFADNSREPSIGEQETASREAITRANRAVAERENRDAERERQRIARRQRDKGRSR